MVGKCRVRGRVYVLVVVIATIIMVLAWGLMGPLPHHKTTVSPETIHRAHLPRVHYTTDKRLQTEPVPEVPSDRFWHLDLKGGAPRIEVLEGMMVLAARAGATGVLIEWEDAFPYTGALANLSAYNAYTHEEVKRIASAARDAGLTLVHLMQSLGHLEYALKLPQWAALREGESPGEACPSRPDTSQLVADALDQLISAVPTTMIHIGADEVSTLGQCSRCRVRSLAPLNLYLDHVIHVARQAKARWGVRVLMWDDMIRRAPLQALRSLAGVVEPVIWAYGPDVTKMVQPYILRAYAATFPKVWLAPAFKGATGPRAIMPNAARHVANTLAWVQVGQRMHEDSSLGVSGLIITGWSRYDHFSVLCELLPPSTPSLVLTLLTASRGSLTPADIHDAHALLDCPPHAMLDPARDPHLWALRDCSFPGANVVSLLHRYTRLQEDVRDMQREVEKGGWLTQYNIRYNFSSPSRVRKATSNVRIFSSDLRDLYEEARAILAQYHDTATVQEWVEQHLDPLYHTLATLRHVASTLLSFTTWPRRPLSWDSLQYKSTDYKSNFSSLP